MDFLSPALPLRLLQALGLMSAHQGVCDIYASGGTPCVAAHSTVRALYGSYDGPLYQVIRGSDNTTKDVTVHSTGGIARSSVQDHFCKSTTCLISIIYDQSGKGNHLTRAPPGSADVGEAPGGYDILASAVGAPITLDGHKVYGVFTPQGAGYRNNNTTGIAVGNEAEGIYAVVDGTHWNQDCCYDYGNAELTTNDEGRTTMETLFFGGGHDQKDGPRIMADIEDGVYSGYEHGISDNYPPLKHRFVTGIVKGADHNLWSIRAGGADGELTTYYAGPRPEGYYPMNKKGAVLLGVGGDNSFRGVGTFFEGAMTIGYPTDETENKVQENIRKAKYGTTSLSTGPRLKVGSIVVFKPTAHDSYLSVSESDIVTAPLASEPKPVAFKVRHGNNGEKSCFSFESVHHPGKFVRQANYTLHLDSADSKRDSRAPLHWIRSSANTFEDDTTFCTEPAFDGPRAVSVSVRSWNFPQRYIRAPQHGQAHIAQNGGVEEWDSVEGFHQETSWTVLPHKDFVADYYPVNMSD